MLHGIFTSPAEAVAKYCNEYVCLCVCVCVCVCVGGHISRTPRAIFTNFVHVAYRRSSDLLRRGDEIPREEAILGVFFSDDNALYNKASETHTKVAEPIEMPFGMMTWVGHKYHVLDRGPDPPRKRGNFGGKRSGPL